MSTPVADRRHVERKLLSVVIPAMNEAGTIHEVLSQYCDCLRQEQIPFELVVVNDVASDNTSDVLRSLLASLPEVRAYDRTGGKGYGSAVALGIDLARGDYVVISSADACNIAKDVVAYYHGLEEGYDAVFGSRFIPGASVTGYPRFKIVVNRISNTMLQFLFGFRFNDYTDGFKAYRKALLDQCKPFFSTKFNITIELSLKAMLLTNKIKQVPTQWFGRHWGSSKLSIVKVLRYYFASLLFVIGLRIIAQEFLRAARSRPTVRQVLPEDAGAAAIEPEVKALAG
jgi:dolichol-phosphate mannosyltransferase